MKSGKVSTIKVLYWVFLIGFVAHILSFILTTNVYFSNFPMLNSEVRVIPTKFESRVLKQTNDIADVKIFEMNNTKSTIKYLRPELMNAKSWTVFFLTILHQLIWIWFTWLLLSLFRSLKNEVVFARSNIVKIRLVALVIGLSPLIQLIKNILFAEILSNQVKLTDKHVAYHYDYSLFSGLFYMVLIFVLVEVFNYGMKLKQENDLTI
ncbi:MAG: DUF2975 domain-containing protein [Bacteroidia bacterium]|nr:DUF2975 domain-containing protein [Bacteroidia bacterium]